MTQCLPFIPLRSLVNSIKNTRQSRYQIKWMASSEKWQGSSVMFCYPDDLRSADAGAEGVATQVVFVSHANAQA